MSKLKQNDLESDALVDGLLSKARSKFYKTLEEQSKEWEDFVNNTDEGQELLKAAQELDQIRLDYIFSEENEFN